jgi:hypothetical protein
LLRAYYRNLQWPWQTISDHQVRSSPPKWNIPSERFWIPAYAGMSGRTPLDSRD